MRSGARIFSGFTQAFSPFFRYDFKLLKLSENLRVKSRKSSCGKGLSDVEKVGWGDTTLFSLHSLIFDKKML